jgi:hypothetical protein
MGRTCFATSKGARDFGDQGSRGTKMHTLGNMNFFFLMPLRRSNAVTLSREPIVQDRYA